MNANLEKNIIRLETFNPLWQKSCIFLDGISSACLEQIFIKAKTFYYSTEHLYGYKGMKRSQLNQQPMAKK
jgi:hypothetical protein